METTAIIFSLRHLFECALNQHKQRTALSVTPFAFANVALAARGRCCRR